MKTEKHIIKGHFKGKRPHVKVTAYELSTVDCSADKMSGYYSQETTLISDDPEPGYDFAGWSVTGSNVTGNNVRFEGDITAKANYSAHVYNVTLQNDGHGTIAADKTTGNLGDTITLSNSPATHYHFSGYSLTGATLTSNQFNIETNDVTAKGWFSEDPKYNLTLQNDGHGSIGAGKTTGYQSDTTTLSNTANNGYVFSAYTVTGATLNGSTLTFGAEDATAKAWFSAVPQSALYYTNNNGISKSDGGSATLNINKSITSYRYAVIKFNFSGYRPNTGGTWIGGDAFQINPIRWYVGLDNTYNTTVRTNYGWTDASFTYNNLITTARHKYYGTYYNYYMINNSAVRGDLTYKFVIDRNITSTGNNNAVSAYVNNVYYGCGNWSSSNTISNITMLNFSTATWKITTLKNIRVAGFGNFNEATAYNG